MALWTRTTEMGHCTMGFLLTPFCSYVLDSIALTFWWSRVWLFFNSMQRLQLGGGGVPLSVVGQDNISLLRPACLQGPKPVFLTHLQGMKSEECTPNLHPLLSLQRNIDGGPFMEPDQDLQAPRRSVFHVCLYHLTLGSFSCFCAQTVHSGRIHNAAKLQTFQRVIVGQAGGPW